MVTDVHFAGIDLVEELRIADFGGVGARRLALEQAEQRKEQQGDDDPDGETAEIVQDRSSCDRSCGTAPDTTAKALA